MCRLLPFCFCSKNWYAHLNSCVAYTLPVEDSDTLLDSIPIGICIQLPKVSTIVIRSICLHCKVVTILSRYLIAFYKCTRISCGLSSKNLCCSPGPDAFSIIMLLDCAGGTASCSGSLHKHAVSSYKHTHNHSGNLRKQKRAAASSGSIQR